jgi:hypothetical protein
MNKFVPLLQKINEKLDLPQPIKSRIILEMVADLNDLYETYRSKGLSEEEAIQKTEEKFDVSEDTIKELAQVHTTGFRKYLDKLSQRSKVTWETIILSFMVLSIAVYSSQTIFKTTFVQNASIFVYPISIVFLGIVIISISKFYQLYIQKDHDQLKLRSGMNLIIDLGIINILTGGFGYIFVILSSGGVGEFYVPFLLIIFTVTSPESLQMLITITQTMIKISSLMMICILSTMLSALIWFGLMNKISKIEQAEAEILLESEIF